MQTGTPVQFVHVMLAVLGLWYALYWNPSVTHIHLGMVNKLPGKGLCDPPFNFMQPIQVTDK